MLSKAATIILGLLQTSPKNPYEIVRQLQEMHAEHWYTMASSTVYATMKSLEKKGFITGTIAKEGNMPEKTIYTVTDGGYDALLDTLRHSIITFDYDANLFSIAAFFLELFDAAEQKQLLEARLDRLHQSLHGIERQICALQETPIPRLHIANVRRMAEIVRAEIAGTGMLLGSASH